ncbi:MAG: putative 1-acyl-sn-glycerol-3-phosphate acyltransferase [Candidatus Falkowbacteria bacterium GW2011_GWC2_38_22]|uniref:Putative 1-acyl-sn-glycerol-3-phosphate acyltransferase n=1 Tax=Candidatus Falkowbacteria bacterium GW2011_GWE1_38_31 TaxID=1618638 RepID=A0A0G0JSL8_9BACT|nr:MAG: putative 1-acyl-sn-glycerol-3-phosphate acyltransferase [Candidatus Falkowbacteria bacterium GW2011_GWF2_38_1205]KKQ60665.1 MAG: putative 1-acyl-sn-glycerol-3-phosphate acyltransferase [Candidatus Falkowbacteria bacterium GW2011_GWC2_38_22]KKQ62805.1 MAG: putative 1-acyl-sn-glycerol-3-phosphate acyltransferase [Candidatus Falkowbacteria bacterium GW2011_GWF1_38_22]KKQ64917.1 MAG: putative 1-acyl-sn-glycerol-3-phosphate acyltransferase [Candidatus Falkowbacteria bacterium GW2011_GWE2_38_2
MRFGIFSSKESRKIKINPKKNKKNIFFVCFFIAFMAIIILPMEFFSLFIKKNQQVFFWRKVAILNIKLLLFFGRLDIKIEGKKPKEKKIIYIANHLSHFDGFILLCVLGPETTPVIAPIGYFGFPFSYWFNRMGCIDVQRTESEKEKFRDAHSGFEAIGKAIEELEHDHSILIFPEGHISLQKRLLYFHSGATRIALASETKIMPIAIINIDNLNYGKYFFQPGTVKIVFGDLIDAVKYYKKNQTNIKNTSNMLKIEISNLLPNKYLPLDQNERHPEQTAVFFNINNTIYKGNAFLDLILHFWKKGELRLDNLIFLTFLIFLYKIKLLSKNSLIKYGASIVKGWRADTLYYRAHDIFHSYLSVNVSEKIKTIIIDHKKKGHKVVLITKMVSSIAKLFADYLEADYYLAENLEEKDLKYTGHLLGETKQYDKGEQAKKLAECTGLKLDQSFVYGHDENDLSIFVFVKYKNIVNPKKAFLEKIGNKFVYEIIKI